MNGLPFLVLLVVALFAPAGAQQPQTPPAFRSGVAAVAVPVVVKAGRQVVAGLSADDFVLEDEGVRQHVTVSSGAALPVDVTLVVDVSGSVQHRLQRYQSEVREIASLLRPDDRLRVLSFGTSVRGVVPLQAAGGDISVEELITSGLTSLNDGIATALVRRGEFGRAHLVLVFSDGNDTFSLVSIGRLEALARRSDAVLYLSLKAAAQQVEVPAPLGQPIFIYRGGGTQRALLGVPAERDARERLSRTADETGGGRAGDGLLGSSLREAFEEVIQQFRSSYILTFTPSGVSPDGWHDVTVKLARPGKFTIRARRGYFADAR